MINVEFLSVRRNFIDFSIAMHSTVVRNLTKVWKMEMEICRVMEYGLEVPNLNCLKSYKVEIDFTNFQNLNLKNEE